MTPTVEAVSRTDTGLASELRVSVMRLSRRLRNERSADLGLSALAVLGALFRNGETTLGQLAEYERVKPPSMTRTVGCLVDAGYAVRRPGDSDGRQVLLSITDKGRDIVHADRSRRDAWLVQRMRELTLEERTLLRAAAPVISKLATV